MRHEDIQEIITRTNYDKEAAIIYGDNRVYVNGIDKNRVDIKTELIKNSTIIHSHPNGTSFSAEDIFEIVSFKGKEIIAFNDDYIYRFKNSLKDDLDLLKLFTKTSSEIESILIKKVNNGTITKSQMDFAINHKVWFKISQELKGFDYEAFEISK